MNTEYREVIICNEVLERLKENEFNKMDEIYLLGTNNVEKTIKRYYIIGFIDSSFSINNNYPYNITINGAAGNSERLETIQEYFSNNNQLSSEEILYLNFNNSKPKLWMFSKSGNFEAEEINFKVQTKNDLYKELFYFRIQMKFELDQNIEGHSSSYISNLLDKKVGTKPIFYFKESKHYLSNSDEDKVIGDIQLENSVDYKIINVNVYQNLSTAPNENEDISDFPIIHQTNEPYDEKIICCQLDGMCVISKRTSFRNAYEILKNCIKKNAEVIYSFLLSNSRDLPAVHHFAPKELCHFVTIVCSHNQIDSYSNLRKTLHNAFKLSMTRPFFRVSNAYLFDAKPMTDEDGLLTNVHEGLTPSGIKNGEISLVQGIYTYYHYGHGGFNDHQWGCAYRSLQTLYSWFKWQGWTNKPVPSITCIQQTLVDMGDKPKQFVGSKNWIGSMEVSYVLDSQLGVTCRIMSLRQGDTLNSVCLELAEHFSRHGTPVMIGGGVLAHTILGVDINEERGEAKFLVLDPHYTGTDNLKSVHGKGVFWKDASFWKKDAFYNLCLPLKFNGI